MPGTDVRPPLDVSSEPIATLHAVVNGAAVREGTILPPVPVIPPEGSPLADKPPPELPVELKPAKPGGDNRS